ncbi:MAG: hypothetical protein ACI8Z1_000904 [Candidatus Azotimanducaceae bacterium]|jgi:hypothetical protein
MPTPSNVVSLSSVRDARTLSTRGKDAGSPEDNRAEARELTGERLFVQITQADDKDLIGKTMACSAIDASAHGIKFLADDFIPVGCQLDLWVDDEARPGKFFLSGESRWTQKVGRTSTMVGVRLQDGLATDIESWQDSRSS